MTFLDSLFGEYASPFLLLDGVIASGRLMEFIETFQDQKKERQRWEFYINKLPPWDNTTWEEFNANLDAQETEVIPPEQLEATVTDSFSMLQGFEPDEQKKEGKE